MGGVLFGRTLSSEVDSVRLEAILAKQHEIPECTLVELPPVRSFEVFWGSVDHTRKVLSGRYICDADSPEGQLILERMKPDRIKKIPNPEYEKLKFATETARAVQEGILVGLSPNELEDMARQVGFAYGYTECREHPWKPTKDFYFRFEKKISKE